MPQFAPTPEMTEFASKHGGVVVRDADMPFGRHIAADPACSFALKLLKDFEGVRNAEGITFRSDLQMLDHRTPCAMTGYVGGRFCIGITAGCTVRIMEISAAVTNILFLGVDSARCSIPDWGGIGSHFLSDAPASEADTAHRFDVLLGPLHEAGHSQKHIYLSNVLLLFVMLREIRAIVDGHLLYGLRAQDLPAESRSRLQAFCTLDVDSNAFGFVVMNLLRGLPIFHADERGFSTMDRLRAFQLGVMMLVNADSPSQPRTAAQPGELASADRIINFTNLLVRISTAMPASWDDLDGVYRDLSPILRSLSETEPRFVPLASSLARAEVARHEQMAERLMGSLDVRRAQGAMKRLAFAPKNMPSG